MNIFQVEDGPIVALEGLQLKPRNQLWCSGCAGQGHLEHECNYYNREYPPTHPCIFSYEDVLRKPEDKNPKGDMIAPSQPPPVCANNNVCPPSFLNHPSSSQDISYPSTFYIPPLTPQIASRYPQVMPLGQHNMTVSNCTPSSTALSTKVLNSFSILANKQGKYFAHATVLNQMLCEYLNNDNDARNIGCFDEECRPVFIHPEWFRHSINMVLKNEEGKVKQIILYMPCDVVKQFLRKEVAELENVVSQTDPKYLKSKLYKYNKIFQTRKRALRFKRAKEKCFWYRILNMYIFGVHHVKDGKIHVNHIKEYLSQPKQNTLDMHKRKSLLYAYNYIFNAHCHTNINYYTVIYQLISRNKKI